MPTLREERRLLRSGHVLVAGMDEVGRGALAGPVSVGVVVVDATVGTAPAGVRDSKLLTPAAREALVPRLRRWAPAHAVGHAEPAEIDRYGIIAALRLAGRRALAALPETPTCVLLDGSHDWLSPPRPRRPGGPGRPGGPDTVPVLETEPLFELDVLPAAPSVPGVPAPGMTRSVGADLDADDVLPDLPPEIALGCRPQVLTMIKADLRCAAVAAASVLAKVERDAIMRQRSEAFPWYGWWDNKGYSAPEHFAALAEHGACAQHRRSWSLPGVPSSAGGPGLFLGDVPDLALLGGDLLEVLDLEDDVDLRDGAEPDDETGPSLAGAVPVEDGTAGGAFEDVRR